jgi:hypothetical protein
MGKITKVLTAITLVGMVIVFLAVGISFDG